MSSILNKFGKILNLLKDLIYAEIGVHVLYASTFVVEGYFDTKNYQLLIQWINLEKKQASHFGYAH